MAVVSVAEPVHIVQGLGNKKITVKIPKQVNKNFTLYHRFGASFVKVA